MSELDAAAQGLADAIAGRDTGTTGRMTSAVVTATPSIGDATVDVYLDGGSVAVPARVLAGVVPVAGDRVLVWSAGARLWVLGSAGPVSTNARPWRMAAGTLDVTVSGGVGSATVTYPAGRFTVQPLVVCGVGGGTAFNAQPSAHNGTVGFTVMLNQIGGSAFSGQRATYWHAVQMAPGSAAG